VPGGAAGFADTYVQNEVTAGVVLPDADEERADHQEAVPQRAERPGQGACAVRTFGRGVDIVVDLFVGDVLCGDPGDLIPARSGGTDVEDGVATNHADFPFGGRYVLRDAAAHPIRVEWAAASRNLCLLVKVLWRREPLQSRALL